MATATESVVAQTWASEASLALERTRFAPADSTSEEQVLQSISAALTHLRRAVPATSCKRIVQRGAASATQEALMHAPGPLFIEGRSGTGKTTVISGRIALNYQKANALLFVTRSSMLRDEVQRTLEGAGVRCGRLPATPGVPALATWDELLRQIGRACRGPQGNAPPVLTFEIFCRNVLPRLKKVSDFGPHLLWAEFISRLSGPVTPSLEAYEKEAVGFSATGIRLRPEDFCVILHAFNEYKLFKKKRVVRDDADRAAMLADLMADRGSTPYVDELLVDEVQDFTPGECRLLLALCRKPAGLCFAGDTAQTITNGCGFTFEYLRRLVRDKFGVYPPEAVHLGTNYRSTMGIVELGKAQVQLLERFFPGTVDHIEAVAHHKTAGDRPLFLSLPEVATTEDCVSAIQGILPRLDPAIFLVIVRTDAQRQMLRTGGLNATILTVEESKGLERQIVVVVDFFRDSPARRAGLLWNFPRAALPVSDAHGYRTQDGESRIAWLLNKQVHPESLGRLNRRDRADLYALAPAVLEMKQLYVADTRAARQLVHVERGTRLAKHMLDFYAHAGSLVERVGLEDLGEEGVASHPSVSKCVSAYGGPCIEHVLDVTEKSMELYHHASDDSSRTAVFGEAARTLKESREELLCVPCNEWRDGWKELQLVLSDCENLSRGHWHRRFQNDPGKAARAYLAARVPALAGEAFAAAGEHLDAAACYLHIDPPAAASQLRMAGELGRGMVVLLSTEGEKNALSQARDYLDSRAASPEAGDALLAALQQCFLLPNGASWLLGEQGSEAIVKEWFLRTLLRSDLEPWAQELLQGMPQLVSEAFAAAATALMRKHGAQLRLVELCRRVATNVDPGQLSVGALSEDGAVGALLVLTNALPPLPEYGDARLEAALGALEVFCSQKLRPGTGDLTQQLKECQLWRGAHLPQLDNMRPDATKWPLSTVVLASQPGVPCIWGTGDAAAVGAAVATSWEWDDKPCTLSIVDKIGPQLCAQQRALSEGVERLRRMCKRERYSRDHLQWIGRKMQDILREIVKVPSVLSGAWVNERLPLGELDEHCPGAAGIMERLRGICAKHQGAAYTWYRLTIKQVRDQGEGLQRGWQLGEIALLCRGKPVDLGQCNVSVSGGKLPDGMHFAKLQEKREVCGNMGWLTMEFGKVTAIDSYRLRTAHEKGSEAHDPLDWSLEGSFDGEHFEPLHTTKFDTPQERGKLLPTFSLCQQARKPEEEVRDVVGAPPYDMIEILQKGDAFSDWIAKEVRPTLDAVVTHLCRLVSLADELDIEPGGRAPEGVRGSLRFIHESELTRLPPCQETLVKAFRRALGSDVLPSSLDAFAAKARVPVLNPVLLKALAPTSSSCTLSEKHLQQLANCCLVA